MKPLARARATMKRSARRRALALVTASTALIALSTAACGSDDSCCAPRPRDYGLPKPHGPGTEIDYPSQALSVRPLAGMDFSVFVRLDEKTSADWSVADSGDEDGVLRYERTKTVRGTPDGESGEGLATHTKYFVFHAEKPGASSLVLEDSRSGRTMTYAVDVVKAAPGGPESPAGSVGPTTVEGRRVAQDFQGIVTVKRGERFAVANSYSNVPGIKWRIARNTSPDVSFVISEREEPATTGDPAGNRQDWYTFTAAEKGTTTVRLSGCYRCSYETAAKSPESKMFSETKVLTIRVR